MNKCLFVINIHIAKYIWKTLKIVCLFHSNGSICYCAHIRRICQVFRVALYLDVAIDAIHAAVYVSKPFIYKLRYTEATA